MSEINEIILPIPIYGKLESVNVTANGEINIELTISKEKKLLIEAICKAIATLEGEDVMVLINLLRRRE